jgi:hypothetical protein
MNPVMTIVTKYERNMILDRVQLDTLVDRDKWSFNTYDRLTELIDCKVKCTCSPCEIIRHQINLQLRLVFAQTNKFADDHTLCDIVKETCESIFSLITKTHFKIDFTCYKNICDECHEAFAIACASELIKEKEENGGPVPVISLYSQLKACILCPEIDAAA